MTAALLMVALHRRGVGQTQHEGWDGQLGHLRRRLAGGIVRPNRINKGAGALKDSVGGTPTDAVETTALPAKSLMTGISIAICDLRAGATPPVLVECLAFNLARVSLAQQAAREGQRRFIN